MKLDELALLEIVDIIRDGIMNLRDVSEELRKLEFVNTHDDKLALSEEYKRNKK